MRTHGKKFQAAATKVDRLREYPIPDAVALVKGSSYAKFDETVDVAVNLGVDPRHADQVVRGTVVLPHGTGKSVRVLVITQGDRVREAEAAGADFVGIEYIQKIKEGWLECDVIVATPDVMG
jgi:large subunit ribosomal protein L1